MTVIIDVPYHSQIEPGALWASNDCGVACVWQLAKYDRDLKQLPLRDNIDTMAQLLARHRWGYDLKVPDQVRAARSRFSTIADLAWLATQYRVTAYPSDASRPATRLTVDRLRAELDKGRPTIVLVLYELMPTRHFTAFGGGHYVVVTGYDQDLFFLNDPYFPGQAGKEVTATSDELALAIQPGKPNPYFSVPSGLYYGGG